MAVYFGTQMTKIDSVAGTPSPGFVHGTVRCFAETINLATVNGGSAVTTSDTIEVGFLPKGSVFLYGVINTTATLSTSTVALGIAGTTGKYRAAAVLTATDTPAFFGVGAASNVAEAADRKVIATIAVASLPTSGTVTVTLFYSHN